MWRFGIMVVSLVSTVLAGVLVLGQANIPVKAFNPALDWPPFSMVVKAWDVNTGPNLTPGFARFKIDYNGPTHWRMEVIEYPGQENVVGMWFEYDGKNLRSFDPKYNQLNVRPAPPDGHYAPPEILRRTRSAAWKGWGGWQQGTDQFGSTIRRKVGEFRNERGEKVIEETEIVIDRNTSLPLKIVDRQNGQVIKEATVEKLTLR